MARTSTFTGFAPTHPAGRQFDHWAQMVPEINRVEDDTQDARRFSNCIQEVLDLLLTTVDEFTRQYDIDTCSDAAVDQMLTDLGNPFAWDALELSPIQRRKLVTYLVEIYKHKGTAQGIEQTVLFLLNEVVTVVPYLTEGWVLGVDYLGTTTDGIAEISTLAVAPFDFTAISQPWAISFAVDDGVPQTVTFVPADFANPASATAAEVASVIEAQLTGAGTYLVADGAPAMVVGSTSAPFALSGGEVLQVDVQDVAYTVTFAATDFETPGSATLDEVLRVLRSELPVVRALAHPSGGVALYTPLTGDQAQLVVSAGAAATALGLTAGTYVGLDGERVFIYSQSAGTGATIACTTPGGDVSVAVLGLWGAPGAGTCGTILAPSLQRALYTFDLEFAGDMDVTTERLVRDIANYIKAAHEHLANIRVVPTVVLPDGWILGRSRLDETTVLFEGQDAVPSGGAGGGVDGDDIVPILKGFGHGPFGHMPFGHTT